ncbi:MAG: hypothetical protein HOO06_08625 [Bdellovibrionaceae bacterium]|jgi:hypothetical protein|nr:hypothetical protein [Pseudobdellovibrionaceae bacterium]
MNMSVEKIDDKLEISFFGEISEDVALEPLSFTGINTVVFDLEGISLLNSCGLRTWILWIREIPSETVKKFKNCPRIVVEQMNILEGFLPKNSVIESFYIPYYCDDCDKEYNKLALEGEDFVAGSMDSNMGVALSEIPVCKECGEEMELDVVPLSYFKFLK